MAAPHARDITLGSPKHFLRLGQALATLGHTVDYLFRSNVPRPLRPQRLLYVTFPLLVLQQALRGSYDVLHVASGDAWLAAALRRRSRRRRPAVINHVLGVEHIDWEESQRSWRAGEAQLSLKHRLWFGGVRLSEVRASVRLSDQVLCSCRQDSEYMIKHGWRRPGGVAIVPPGIDDIYLNAQPAALDGSAILFIGTWITRKGVLDLVAAFVQVLSEIPSARLIVAGVHMPPVAVLQAFPAEAQGAVRVAGPGTERDLLALMHESAVMVLPSLYEGFGMAFAEGMAVGVPVIGTPTGGMADMIEPGVNGVLVPPRNPAALGNALLGLLQDPARRRCLGGAARASVEQLTWERAARQTATVYEHALANA